jgi:hypothetical protein
MPFGLGYALNIYLEHLMNILPAFGLSQLIARYPFNLGSPPVDKWILFEVRSGRHVVRNTIAEASGKIDRTIASVGLYLTEEALTSKIDVGYEEADLAGSSSFIGAGIELLARTGQNLFNTTLGGLNRNSLQEGIDVQGILKSVIGAASSVSLGTAEEAFKSDALRGIQNIVGSRVATGALTGQTPNPRTDMQFSAAKYRTHSYNFTMIPRNLGEAQAIDRIVNFFQFYMLPSYKRDDVTAGLQIGSFMMGFPYEFEISFRDEKGAQLQHVNRVARSVLESCTIDHAGAKKTAFVNSNGELYPMCTTLSVNFKEVKLLARPDEEIQRSNGIDPNDPNMNPPEH